MFNIISKSEKIPKEWKKARITMLHKGTDKRVIDNYRGNSITYNVGKSYTTILGRRLEEDVEKKGLLGKIQFGFRKGRRTTDAIYILSQKIKKQKKKWMFFCR